MTSLRLDQGSFRDREGRVFYRGERVYRALSETAAREWQRLSSSTFFDALVAEGKIVGTRNADLSSEELHELSERWVTALEHDRIPFISYPYEWSFGMLRDAAALQLELLDTALGDGMILKDSSSYNVQWRGAQPTFIDISSFEEWKEGDPWAGYLQFCQLFLYPLMLTAYRNVAFHPWLRGTLDGPTSADCNQLFTFRDRFRAGVFADVYLQAKLQARSANSDTNVRSDLQKAGFRKELITHNVRRLQKVVGKLQWRAGASQWSDYEENNSYDRENREIKERFVKEAAAKQRWPLAWDLGCNTGAFSRLISAHADYVVAFDADHLAVERLYQSLKKDGPKNILPLLNNLADASPPLGWRHRERLSLTDRATPDFTLCLALIHHIVLTANVPLPEFVDWLRSLDSALVIEFVTKDDAMVKKLLRNKADIYEDYEIGVFERCLSEKFSIREQTVLQDGTRKLYFATPGS